VFHLDLRQELQGIIASLHTPFTTQNTIDPDSLVHLVEHCANSGCSGVLVTAVAGEVGALTRSEREQLLRHTVEAAGDRLHIVAGISAASVDDSVTHARTASKFGIPVLMWQPPAGLDEDQLRTGLRRIAAQGDHQIMLQDLDWTGSGIAPEIIARLADAVPALTAIKIETASCSSLESNFSTCSSLSFAPSIRVEEPTLSIVAIRRRLPRRSGATSCVACHRPLKSSNSLMHFRMPGVIVTVLS